MELFTRLNKTEMEVKTLKTVDQGKEETSHVTTEGYQFMIVRSSRGFDFFRTGGQTECW